MTSSPEELSWIKNQSARIFLAVQWLRPHSSAGGCLDPLFWGVSISHASWPQSQSMEQKQYCSANSIKKLKNM